MSQRDIKQEGGTGSGERELVKEGSLKKWYSGIESYEVGQQVMKEE